MINIGKCSELSAEEIIAKSIKYFGPSGLGLRLTEKDNCCARFDGSGGFVNIQITKPEQADGSELTVMGREYDYQIKKFLRELD